VPVSLSYTTLFCAHFLILYYPSPGEAAAADARADDGPALDDSDGEEEAPELPKEESKAKLSLDSKENKTHAKKVRGLGVCERDAATYSDQTVANRNGRGFGWEIAHAAVSRRPPISLYTMVARTEGYTYDARVWDLFLVQGPFPVAPCQTPDSHVLHRRTHLRTASLARARYTSSPTSTVSSSMGITSAGPPSSRAMHTHWSVPCASKHRPPPNELTRHHKGEARGLRARWMEARRGGGGGKNHPSSI
jgi:hypothetical protein